MAPALHYSLTGRVARIRLDDGKANALGFDLIAALRAALAQAEKEAGAALLLGREGRFSGGYDLSVMGAGIDAIRGLVRAGGELFTQMLDTRIPIVAGCTGHAIAGGALLLLASDYRVGSRGNFKLGLSEVALGMTLPIYALELAQLRVSKRHLARATQQAELYTPEGAVDAGFLDRAVEPAELEASAAAEAARLAELPQPAYADTKRRGHRAALEQIRATFEMDMARVQQGPSTAKRS
jgi:enoyl-CoA hydratase